MDVSSQRSKNDTDNEMQGCSTHNQASKTNVDAKLSSGTPLEEFEDVFEVRIYDFLKVKNYNL